ncbi:plasmid SOS inhibition protein A [Klebsiella pneumoniae]|nr:plasmid SOS inhibition protein A [Klebsiella pneumoniae]
MIPFVPFPYITRGRRGAALQAIMTVENAPASAVLVCLQRHTRTFVLPLTGNSRMEHRPWRSAFPGLNWDPKHRLSSLGQVEEVLDALIASHGECCPLPPPVDAVQAEPFLEVQHSRTDAGNAQQPLPLPVRCVGKNVRNDASLAVTAEPAGTGRHGS